VDDQLPATGRPWQELQQAMTVFKQDDLDWRRGRHAAYVWYATDEVEQVASDAYTMFMTENGLGARVFPSLRRMESGVVRMVADLLDGGPEAAGHMTSGGTESIFLAAKAARDWARAHRPDVTAPEVIAPYSAHPAINKAAHYLGMSVVRVPTDAGYRADVVAMAQAITPNTIMLYGSAPAYSLGVIDPIGALGELAKERGLWLHVDACVGGVLGPFVRRLGYPVPEFGLNLPGISSISADVHKSGYAAKGASVILFRDAALQSYSRYEFDDWPTGLYSTLTFTGTRPGGAIAAAWAVMQHLGADGYLGIAETVMRAKTRFVEGVSRIEGLRLWGEPDLWAVGFGATGYDIFAVADGMTARGWAIGRIKQPPGIHLMITPVHEPVLDDYLNDLEAATRAAPSGTSTSGVKVVY
jgi:sphinganine-1-phosphate aldolase